VTFAVIGAALVGFATVVRAHESAGHAGHSATLMQDGAILIAGGRNDAGAPVAEAQVYVIAVGQVHATGSMASPRDRHAATLLPDGRVLVTGGRDGQGELDSMEIFEPSLGTFSLLPSTMLQARQGHTAVVTGDGRVLIQGGTSGGVPVDTTEFFDPADDSVTEAASLDGVTLASVASDWPDYYPGDVVTITGGGWLPGETVTLLFDEEPVQHYPRLLAATADGDGNIVNSEYVIEEHDLGTDFLLTASGGTSGMTAQVKFTDSPKVGSVAVGAQSPSPVTAGGSATYTVTVNRGSGPGSPGAFTATLSIEPPGGLPAGAIATFSPNPVSFAAGASSRTSTLTIAVANCTSASTSGFTVKAATSASDFATNTPLGGPPGSSLAITALNCNDGNVCTVDSCVAASGCVYTPGNLGTECRASAGACDVAESCTGSSATCPANGFQSSSTVCRGSEGVCDVSENCTGSAAACPADAKSTAVCRDSAGVCDLADSCDGINNACPADGFKPTSTVCRPSAGACDLADSCTGSAAACSADAKSTAVCRDSAGVCDLSDSCDGTDNACPADAKSTAVCRDSAGVCDLSDSCDGTNDACPADVKSTAVCRDSAGVCDLADSCDGTNDACPADAKSTAVCRDSAGVCDLTDSCDGTNDACPGDAKSTAICRISSGPDICDDDEACNGVSDDCPGDDLLLDPDTTAPILACTPDHEIVADDACDGSYSISATATDNCDAHLDDLVCAPPGTLSGANSVATPFCSVTDEAENTGSCLTTVTLVDQTSPTATCNSLIVPTASQYGLCTATLAVKPTGLDNCDESLTFSCGTDSLLQEGPGSVSTTCTSKDDSGNVSANCESKLTLEDDTDPTVECNYALVKTSSQGGLCSASLPVAPTGEDNCDPTLHFICGKSSLSVTAPGSDSTSCVSEDDSENTSDACTSTLTLVDDTKPVFDSLARQTFLGSCAGANVSFVPPTASDTCQQVNVTCPSLPGNSFGDNTVTCTATDGSGNSSTVDIVVTVLEPLRVAFRPPLEDDNVADDIQTDADVRNLFKSGQTIPHKTKLYNCAGADVTTAVAATAKLDVTLRDSGNASFIAEIAETYNGVGGPGGLMVLTDSQFHYNLATSGYQAGTLSGTKYFRSTVRVSYNSSPAIVVGHEDATLESR